MQNCRAFLLKSSNCVSNPLMQLVLVHIKGLANVMFVTCLKEIKLKLFTLADAISLFTITLVLKCKKLRHFMADTNKDGLGRLILRRFHGWLQVIKKFTLCEQIAFAKFLIFHELR